MSELKATRIKMVYNGEVYDDFGTEPFTQLYYRKSEADKVIAELKSQKAQAEDDCAYWKMREGNAVNAMRETEEACMFLTKSERHQKYKRCLAMAKWCATERDLYKLMTRFAKMAFYMKWHKRWLKLAEKFKGSTNET